MATNSKLKLGKGLHLMIADVCKGRVKSVSIITQLGIFFLAAVLTAPVRADAFIGAKIGKMMVDVPSSSDPTNIAINIGYEFDSLLADLSLVGEINRTMSSGRTDTGDVLEFESEAVYLVWKSTRSLFASLRGGVVQNETITGITSRRSNGIYLGGSVGIVIGKTRLQLEYTSLAGDANFLGLSLEL